MASARRPRLPSGMRWRGEKIAVSVYDPDRPGGSRHLGTFAELEGAGGAIEAKRAWDRRVERKRRGFREWTAAEFCAVWCVSDYLRPQETTNIHNRQMVKAFARDFGSMSLREVSESRDLCRLWAFGGTVRDDLEALAGGWVGPDGVSSVAESLDERGRMTAPAHVRAAKVVSAMFEDARRSQIVELNPWSTLRLPTVRGRTDIDPLRPSQVTQLIDKAVELHPDYPDLPAMIATAAYTGMRLGELIGLRWEDLDLEGHRVWVRRQSRDKDGTEALPKYGGVRRIVLPPAAVRELRKIPRHIDGYVFHIKSGRRYSQRIHHFYWNPIRVAIGLPDLKFHDLRHFCGSYMADHGATPRDIAHQFGHKDGGILAAKLYCHTYTENANDRLGAIFGL